MFVLSGVFWLTWLLGPRRNQTNFWLAETFPSQIPASSGGANDAEAKAVTSDRAIDGDAVNQAEVSFPVFPLAKWPCWPYGFSDGVKLLRVGSHWWLCQTESAPLPSSRQYEIAPSPGPSPLHRAKGWAVLIVSQNETKATTSIITAYKVKKSSFLFPKI